MLPEDAGLRPWIRQGPRPSNGEGAVAHCRRGRTERKRKLIADGAFADTQIARTTERRRRDFDVVIGGTAAFHGPPTNFPMRGERRSPSAWFLFGAELPPRRRAGKAVPIFAKPWAPNRTAQGYSVYRGAQARIVREGSTC